MPYLADYRVIPYGDCGLAHREQRLSPLKLAPPLTRPPSPSAFPPRPGAGGVGGGGWSNFRGGRGGGRKQRNR
jgi:hypothetical protein